MKHNIVFWVVLLTLVVAMGCNSEPACPDCPSPGTWSACNEDAIKTRTNYRCSEATEFECQSYTEDMACGNQIFMRGTKSLEAVISPSVDENVKGIIKVEAVSVPPNTELVNFLLMSEGTVIVREVDTSATDGWKAMFDTTKLENGLYDMFVGPSYNGAPEESPWLDFAQTQIVVNN